MSHTHRTLRNIIICTAIVILYGIEGAIDNPDSELNAMLSALTSSDEILGTK